MLLTRFPFLACPTEGNLAACCIEQPGLSSQRKSNIDLLNMG